jgi:hypothetical protein
MKTEYTVLVTDKNHEFFNQRLEGFCAYYDIYHTGKGPDLYLAKTPKGIEFRLISDQIDIEDYHQQKLKNTIKRLGADVNEIVMITRLGSGCSSPYFDLNQPHRITSISYNGYVIFDNGQADGFEPDVTKYIGDLHVQTCFSKEATNNGMPF